MEIQATVAKGIRVCEILKYEELVPDGKSALKNLLTILFSGSDPSVQIDTLVTVVPHFTDPKFP